MEKQQACCARKTAQITRIKAEMGRVARIAAAKEQKGQDVSRLRKAIADLRAQLEVSKKHVAEHEAEHAGVAVSA